MNWYFIIISGLLIYWGLKGRSNRKEDKKSVITASDVQLVAGIIEVILFSLEL